MMQHPDHSRSFYDVLGVAPTATAARIRVAFLKLAQEWHPDLNQNDQNAERRFKQIRQVYEVLSDPLKRAAYDEDPGRFRLAEGGIVGTESSPICPYPEETADWRTTVKSAAPRRSRSFTPPPISTRPWRPESWLVFCGGIVTILVLTAIPILLMRAHQRQQQFLQARASIRSVTAAASTSPADASPPAQTPPAQERRDAPLDSVLASVASLREQQAPAAPDPALTPPTEPKTLVRPSKTSSNGPLGAGSFGYWPTSELIRTTTTPVFSHPLGKFMENGHLPASGAAPAPAVMVAPDPCPAVVLPGNDREATSIPAEAGTSTLRPNDAPWLLTTSTHEPSSVMSAVPIHTTPLVPFPPAAIEMPGDSSYLGRHEPTDLAALAVRREEPYRRPLSPREHSSGPLSAATARTTPAMNTAPPMMAAPPNVLAPLVGTMATHFPSAPWLGTSGKAPPLPSGILPENARLAGLVTDLDDSSLVNGVRSSTGMEPSAFLPTPGTMFTTGYSTVQNFNPSSGLPLGESSVTHLGLGMMQRPGPAAVDLRPTSDLRPASTLGAAAPAISPLPPRRLP